MTRTADTQQIIDECSRLGWDLALHQVAGIPRDCLDGSHGPCPKCGGTDRWRFTNLNGEGGAICNQCDKFGDGIEVTRWFLGCSFAEAKSLLAEALGIATEQRTTTKANATDPLNRIEFLGWADATARMFCHRKPGITPGGMVACGTDCVRYSYRSDTYVCFGIRVLGEAFDTENPAGFWIIDSTAGKLPAKAKDGVRFEKHKLTFGSRQGIAATTVLINAIRDKRDLSKETVYKVEGFPDLMAIASQNEDVLAFTDSNGTDATPPQWFIDRLASLKPESAFVVPDSDKPGQKGAEKYANQLSKKCKDVRIVPLPYEIAESRGKDLRDYFVDGHSLDDLIALAWKTERHEPPQTGDTGADGRMMVEWSDNEQTVIEMTLPALKSIDNLFQRGDQIVETVTGPHPIAKHTRTVRVEPISLAKLRALVSGRVAYYRDSDRGEIPVRITNTIASQIHTWRQYPDVRELYSVCEFPFLRPDGTICQENGYDESTATFLETNLNVSVKDAPSHKDASDARDRLLSLVREFEFHHGDDGNSSSVSAWLAGLLTLFARPAIRGCVPLFIFEASIQGAGKTRLVDVITTIAFGRTIPRNSWPTREEEVAKSLTAIAMSGVPAVLFDNVKTLLGGPSLEAFVTSETWKSRILGESRETSELPIRQTLFATGNNASFTLDIARRSCFVRLEPNHEDPSSRSFEIPDLLRHVEKNRDQLASDVLTILRGYWQSGMDSEMPAWGGFEDWSNLVRGALIWLGMPDPYDGTKAAKSEANSHDLLPDLIAALDECGMGDDKQLSSRELIARSQESKDGIFLYPSLRDVLDSGCHGRKLNSKLVGQFLKRFEGRIYEGKKISSSVDSAKKIKIWFVKEIPRSDPNSSYGVYVDDGVLPVPSYGESKSKSNDTFHFDRNIERSQENPHNSANPAAENSQLFGDEFEC